MKEQTKRSDLESIYFKVIYWGLLLNVFLPAIFVILGLYLRSKGVGMNPIKGLDFLFMILLLVSATEIFFVFFFRKKFFLSANQLDDKAKVKTGTEEDFIRYSLVLFSLCLSPTIYGFVYYLLGGTLEWFVIFACITLICFRFFKPSLEQMEKFVRVEQTDQQ